MRMSDWSSDVCSSDLRTAIPEAFAESERGNAGAGASVAGRWWLPLAFASLAIASLAIAAPAAAQTVPEETTKLADQPIACAGLPGSEDRLKCYDRLAKPLLGLETVDSAPTAAHSFTGRDDWDSQPFRSAEPQTELPSPMRRSFAA